MIYAPVILPVNNDINMCLHYFPNLGTIQAFSDNIITQIWIYVSTVKTHQTINAIFDIILKALNMFDTNVFAAVVPELANMSPFNLGLDHVLRFDDREHYEACR